MKTKPRCVVIAYDEDNNQIETCTVDRAAIEHLRAASMVMPWSIAEHGGKLDDEFARKLGGASLLLLAIQQPALKSYIAVTKEREDG
ncbi:hypothetical protein A9R05_06260 [Burkholderia sp. KK1]|uniref:Uncharacterized protein n=1 Tax=Caballeronia cordobensis TaxID=1353886 RepID=A0A158FS09_CABCO|nr:hypothetical protein [Caballeronia cordobensis]AQG98477.1 hypothetical protein A9R05_06260 [Burkholderia sp. KK1]SAL22403.1 hypothetical protein AWB70_01207 [Caballeronia cordobensis]